MAFLKKANKADLVQLAYELGVEIPTGLGKLQIVKAIEESAGFEVETAKDFLEEITTDRRVRLENERVRLENEKVSQEKETAEKERERQHELEVLKLRLELAQGGNGDASRSEREGSSERSTASESGIRVRRIDEIVKAIRILTVKTPSKPEGWHFFFKSLEKAFASEGTDQSVQAQVLICLLGEKAANLLTHLDSEEYNDYEAVKKLVLREYEPLPKTCLENFKKAKRYSDENFAQYASRLTASWEYYCQLRGAKDFETVNKLIVSDKIMATLDPELTSHILVNQGDGWYHPKTLAQECDRFFAAKGRKYAFIPEHEKGRGERIENKEARETKSKFQYEKNSGCFSCGSKDHLKRNCPKAKKENKHPTSRTGQHAQVNRVAKSQEQEKVEKQETESPKTGIEEQDRVVIARVDSLQQGKSLAYRGKLQRVTIGVEGRNAAALIDSGSEITVVNQKLLERQDFEGAPSIFLKGIFGPPVKCPLLYVSLTIGEDGKSVRVPKKILCAVAENIEEEVLLPPEIFNMLQGGEPKQVSVSVITAEIGGNSAGRNVGNDRWGLGNSGERTQTPEPVEILSTTGSGGRISAERDRSMTPGGESEILGERGVQQFREEQKGCRDLVKAWGLAKGEKGSFFIADRMLYHRDKVLGEKIAQLVLPKSRRKEVIELAHSSVFGGHLGFRKTVERIRYSFFWESMRKDVEGFCRSCEPCQMTKPVKTSERAPIAPVARPELPFQVVNIDLIGPIDPPSTKGHKYVLCLVDQHTRWAEAVPLRNLSARSTCEALLSIFMRTGIPSTIASDNGTNFNAGLTVEFERRLGASPRFSTPMYPQSNGLVERFNRTLKGMLHHVIRNEGRKWHLQIPYALWAYREIPNTTTGVAPFQLLYGRSPEGPLSILKNAWTGDNSGVQICTKTVPQYLKDLKVRLERAAEQAQLTAQVQQERMAHYYNLRSSCKKYKEGDRVVVLIPDSTNKLYARWQGPAKIVREVRPHSFLVEMEDGSVKHVHQNKIREFIVRASAVNLILEGDEEFGEVDSLPAPVRTRGDYKEVIEGIINPSLTREQGEAMRQVLENFEGLFTRNFQPAKVGEHKIELLPNVERRKPHCYGIPMAYRKEVEAQVQELIELNLIEPSEADVAHPIVCVAKKDATTRVCVDFRSLNAASRIPVFPMKDMHEMIYTAGGAEWLSSLDLRRGYWQIRMEEQSKPLTAFVTHVGTFQWRVMPFGLAGASGTFQRVMNKVLRAYSHFAQAYIDDIIIFSHSFEEHLSHLNAIFEVLDRLNFSINLEKCSLAVKQLSYLGHKIGGGKHGPGEEKVQAIRALERPTTKKEVRSVLGLMGFYRTYIPNYAAMAAPLTDLTRKNAPNKVKWGAEEERAFEGLKEALCGATQLATPDLSRPFQVHSDASEFCVGGCLTQKDGEGNFKPIAFVSKKLTGAQRNWATIEKEAWGVLFALSKFEKWILGGRIEIITDHNPLKYLNETTPRSTKLMRWAMALQRWDYSIVHRPGALHLAADAMSRLNHQSD
jgi:transposase InsO family protein